MYCNQMNRCNDITPQICYFKFISDGLTIYDDKHPDAESKMRTFCGSDGPIQMMSWSNKLLLNFYSDGSGSEIGFRIKIEKGIYLNDVAVLFLKIGPNIKCMGR